MDKVLQNVHSELYDAFREHQYCYDMRSNMGYPAIRVIDHTETQQSDGDGEVLSIECTKCRKVIWKVTKMAKEHSFIWSFVNKDKLKGLDDGS